METNTTYTENRHLRLIPVPSEPGKPAVDSGSGRRRFRLPRSLQKAVLGLAIFASFYLAAHWVTCWYGEMVRDQQMRATLHQLRRRQIHYFRKNYSYAPSLEALKLNLPSDVAGGIKVVSASFQGRPDFLIEFCDRAECQTIDAQGRIRRAMLVRTPTDSVESPSLENGDVELVEADNGAVPVASLSGTSDVGSGDESVEEGRVPGALDHEAEQAVRDTYAKVSSSGEGVDASGDAAAEGSQIANPQGDPMALQVGTRTLPELTEGSGRFFSTQTSVLR